MGVDDQPAVSVIMPALNGARFIDDAIGSVFAQTVPVIELHVIDDGSTDNTADIVSGLADKDSRIYLHRGPQRGPGPARNVGLATARGDVIAFLDCDDLWPGDKLERQLARLTAKPDVSMVGGLQQLFHIEPGDLREADDDGRELSWTLGPCLFKAEVFAQIGHFSDQLVCAEDLDFMMRFREAGMKYSILDRITLHYRKHPDSMTAVQTAAHKRDYQKALFNSLKRRKASGTTQDLPPMRDFIGY
ncbi:MAG: glycosyltransferase family A protein [Pseudomonadota bacterium]